jgi:hypothetical protein
MTIDRRMTLLKGALTVLFLAGGVFLSPLLMQNAYAQESTCSANCARGSCSGKGNCTCSCSIFWGLPMCTCTSPTQPETDPGNG